MSKTIAITPAGRLVLEPAPDMQPPLETALADGLEAALARSSADGLVYLLSSSLSGPLPPALLFWRDFGERFLRAICHLGEEGTRGWRSLPPPSAEELSAVLEAAPPMRGLEYLTSDTLSRLWSEICERAVAQAQAHPGGPIAYLRDINPVWHLLGRVTFHLAENKRDERRPFAFLATYTHRVSAGSRLQHLPLAQALKLYAGAKDQARLAALLEPVRRAAEESPLVRELLDSRELFQPQAWSIRQAYRFLRETPRLEAAGLVLRVPDWWGARQSVRPQVQVRIGQRQASEVGLDALLDFSAELALEGEPLTQRELRQLLEVNEGLVLLRGRWVEVDRTRLQQALDHWRRLETLHPDGIDFLQGMRLLSGVSLGEEAIAPTTVEWTHVVPGEWLRQTLDAIRQPGSIAAPRPGADLRATLRPYQVAGVRWLWLMIKLGLGACLADDMGLGKTIQVIDLLLQLRRERVGPAPQRRSGPKQAALVASLLVVPASLIGNWKQELQRFAPSLRAFYAHPSETDAETLAAVASDPKQRLADFDLVVTTYHQVRRSAWLGNVAWRLIVLDEAQAIKNAASAQTKAVKRLVGQGRVVLTGTPVENHLGDLWSLFDFCCPGLLGSAAQFQAFVKRLNKQQDVTAFASLRQLVRPYILRRMKTDPQVIHDLPEKTEMRVECGLSNRQVALYERAVADLAKRLKAADGMARRGLVLSVLMQLKQICNHPAQYLNQGTFAAKDSGKFGRLVEICEPIVERQEKMLVFTQFQTLCDPLAEFLAGVFGRQGLILSGKTPVRKRTELVQAFQRDEGPPFFVVSVKAGGSGLNLTAASHVVHFDRWWNPAVENQATDRAFRIGQRRNVLVHKFVCRGTIEERIDRMLCDKQDLADKLLSQGGETMLTEMSDQELMRFVSLDLNRAGDPD